MLGLEKSTTTLLEKLLLIFFLVRGIPALGHLIFPLCNLTTSSLDLFWNSYSLSNLFFDSL